jgi:signal peptidase I
VISLSFLLFSFNYFGSEWVSSVDASKTVLGQRLGVLAEPIPIAGTGSMYPTFPKGESEDPTVQAKELVATAGMLPYPGGFSILGNRFFGGYKIKRGDIVSFSNDKTRETTMAKYGEEAGLIKRVIGMPGDQIELRDGILYINKEPQKEGYIAKARSTFGGDFLADCSTLTVPTNKLFVMGDNRTASNDSRFDIGFVDFADVDHVLPLEKQLGVVDKLWRDPKEDLTDKAKISINRTEILNLINIQRRKTGAKELKFDNRLSLSAQKRGEKMIQFDDFTTEAKKSGYGLQQSIGESGYSNIIYGEFYVQGYYEAEQLMENLQEFPKTVEFLNKKDYTDMGFSEVTGLLNGCPTHVIVFHFGGYVPPNYKASDIEGWRRSIDNLRKIQPSWADLRNSGEFYTQNKTEIDQLNNLISSGINSLDSIIKRMESNQWLTDDQKSFADNQQQLYDQIDNLTKILNQKSKEYSSGN